MPATTFYFFRDVFKTLAVVLFVSGSALLAPSAYADPHAVFYTDRAQEQLFYNTLAALNQADFVEPGIGNYSRDVLTGRRSDAKSIVPGQETIGFTPETNPLVNATRTDLPAVVSRSITLEGNDLWTAYLVHQFSLETATRRSSNELARVFCERGLGIVGCATNSVFAQQQQNSFVSNTDRQDAIITIGGDSALFAGTLQEETARKALEENNEKQEHKLNDPPYVPRPDNPEIAALYGNSSSTNEAAIAVTNLSKTVASPGNSINPNTFQDIEKNDDGTIKLSSNIDTADKYLDKLQQITNLPANFISAKNDGIAKQQAFINNRNDTPSLADFRLKRDNESGALRAEFTTPSTARKASVEEIARLEAEAALSQKYASSESALAPGDTYLLREGLSNDFSTDGLGDFDTLPDVSGLANNTNPQQGQVAGLTTDIYDLYKKTFDNPAKTALSPAANPISPNRESGLFNAFVAFTNNTSRKTEAGTDPAEKCAFCIQMDQLLEGVQDTIGELYCTLFPNTASCQSRKPTSITSTP